jgi:hypothetical protein
VKGASWSLAEEKTVEEGENKRRGEEQKGAEEGGEDRREERELGNMKMAYNSPRLLM